MHQNKDFLRKKKSIKIEKKTFAVEFLKIIKFKQ